MPASLPPRTCLAFAGIMLSGLAVGLATAAVAKADGGTPNILFTKPLTGQPCFSGPDCRPKPAEPLAVPRPPSGQQSGSPPGAEAAPVRVGRIVVDVRGKECGENTPDSRRCDDREFRSSTFPDLLESVARSWRESVAERRRKRKDEAGQAASAADDCTQDRNGIASLEITSAASERDRGGTAHCVTVAELFALNDTLNEAVRKAGFSLSRAVVPEQEVDLYGEPAPAGGGGAADFHLTLVAAHITKANVRLNPVDHPEAHPGGWAKEAPSVLALVEDYLERMTELDAISIQALERQLLIVDDIPGVTVQTVLSPDPDELGGVQLLANVTLKKWEGFGTVDNRSSRYTGPRQATVSGRTMGWTRLGEELRLTLYSTASSEQNFAQIDGSIALGSRGLRLKGHGGYGRSRPGEFLRSVGYAGNLLTAGVGFEYPLLRRRRFTLMADPELVYQTSRIDVNDVRDPGRITRQSQSNTTVLRIGARGDWFDQAVTENDVFVIDLHAHKGLPAFDTTESADSLSPRPGARGVFTKYTGELQRMQGIPLNNPLFDALGIGKIDEEFWSAQVNLGLRGQWTSNVLLPGEKFYLGGSRYGRGYYFGEVTGDRGIAGDIELAVTRKDLWFDLDVTRPDRIVRRADVTLFGFYNLGGAYDIDPDSGPPRRVESAGLGLRIDIEKSIGIDFEYARRIERRPGGSDTDPVGAHAFYWRLTGRY